jgi:hypothetical protein
MRRQLRFRLTTCTTKQDGHKLVWRNHSGLVNKLSASSAEVSGRPKTANVDDVPLVTKGGN